MKIWQCKCGWLIAGNDYLRPNYDAMCPECGRAYSTFQAAHPIKLDTTKAVRHHRRRKKTYPQNG